MLAAVLLSAASSGVATTLMFGNILQKRTQEGLKCQLCSKELAFHSGTTNLREHAGTVGPTRVMVQKKRSRELFKRSQGQSAVLSLDQGNPRIVRRLWKRIFEL